MANVLVLKEESRMSRILKDERGMTLIELLATVVILAIIAGIGVSAIGRVIQNSREDAAVAEIQQALNSAKLYQSTAGTVTSPFTLKTVIDEGYHDTPTSTWASTDDIKFTIDSNGVLTMSVPSGQLKAGNETNADFLGKTSEQVLGLTRSVLFPAP